MVRAQTLEVILRLRTNMNLALHATREVDATVARAKHVVVLATTDVFRRDELGAALTNDDLARL